MNFLRFILILFVSFIIWMAINQYFFCPIFSFKPPLPFTGGSFYNPYDSIDCDNWKKCNFHAHTNVWNGLTSGKGTAEDIYHVYDSMNYSVHCVSDYQKINTRFIDSPNYIPAYEHGYNINKTHQLVLGEKKVLWLEYIFPQTLSNKQHILNRLSSDSGNVIVLNHPSDRDGYTYSDLKYLTQFQCIEVLNPFAISISDWDVALSAGKKVFIVGDDDVHDVFASDCLARMCTWVNVSSVKKTSVLNALTTGKCYGMIIGTINGKFPKLNQFKITKDTISVEMSKVSKQISFIGQNGDTLANDVNTLSAKYVIKPEDHYVREAIEYADGTSILLNPVFRYDKKSDVLAHVTVNTQKTFIFRIIGILLLSFWIYWALLFSFSKVNRQKIRKRLHFIK